MAGFATKFNSTGSSLLFSTYLESDYQENGIAVDQSGITYVIGWDPIVPTVAGVTALNRSGTGLIYRKLLDGNGDNFPNGVVVDAAGNTYVAGQTSSSNFPVTAGAFQTAYHGGIDAFVSKIVVAADLAISVSASSNPVAHGSNLTYSIGVFNKGPDGSDGDVLTDTIPTGTTFVSFANTNGTCTAPAVGATGTLTCKRSNRLLAGHWWGPVTLTVKVQAASGSTITNTAHVKSSTQDLVSGNNAVTVKVSVN